MRMFRTVHLIFYFYFLCSVPLCLCCFSGGSFDNGKRPLTKKEAFVVEEVDKMLNQMLKDIKEYGDHIKSKKDGKGSNIVEDENISYNFPPKEGNQPIGFPSVALRVTPAYPGNKYNPQEFSGSSGFLESLGSSRDGPLLEESKDESINLANSGSFFPRNSLAEK